MGKLKYNLPKGWKVWRLINVMPFGYFAVIASRKDRVAIFTFDGINEVPEQIMEYYEIAR